MIEKDYCYSINGIIAMLYTYYIVKRLCKCSQRPEMTGEDKDKYNITDILRK